MRDFRWLFDSGLAAHVRTPLIVLTIVVAAIILATAVLVARALKKEPAAQAAEPEESPAQELPPC